MQFFIIVNKETGEWIPQPKGGKRSKTAVELTKSDPPRLFKRQSDAQNALNYWIQGIWFMSRIYTWEGRVNDYSLDVQRERKRDEVKLVVIPIQINELP